LTPLPASVGPGWQAARNALAMHVQEENGWAKSYARSTRTSRTSLRAAQHWTEVLRQLAKSWGSPTVPSAGTPAPSGFGSPPTEEE
ncbi:MAG: hypothetical protein Q8M92_05595, partial [Candidatus Subteraquimicrobiales bacterium]|nr:hypothetical protein [Candidatus Subteraquimicrobiales bacterium]